MEIVTEAVDQGDAVDLVYLDFSKAFDKGFSSKTCSEIEISWNKWMCFEMD